MNHRPDVANFQARVGHRCGQHDPIVFSNHAEGLLLTRISGHEPRSLAAPIDDPYRTDQPLAALFSVRRQPPLDNMFLAMDRIGILNDIAVFREGSERGYEALRFFDREAEGRQETRLAAVVGMSGVQQVVNEIRGIDSTRDLDWIRSQAHVIGTFRKERDVPMT